MRGHEVIIRQRLRGIVPKAVFINDYPCRLNHGEREQFPTVCTDCDRLDRLDLRFLVDLPMVSIGSTDEARARSLFAKAKAAGALIVGAVHCKPFPDEYTGWAEISHREVEHG